jgi:hypothetical protein
MTVEEFLASFRPQMVGRWLFMFVGIFFAITTALIYET